MPSEVVAATPLHTHLNSQSAVELGSQTLFALLRWQLSKGTVTLGLSAEDADATHGLAVVGCFGINKIESSTSRPTWSRVMVSLSEQATCTELVGLLVTFVRRAHLQ